jgi:hypothetical protein
VKGGGGERRDDARDQRGSKQLLQRHGTLAERALRARV